MAVIRIVPYPMAKLFASKSEALHQVLIEQNAKSLLQIGKPMKRNSVLIIHTATLTLLRSPDLQDQVIGIQFSIDKAI